MGSFFQKGCEGILDIKDGPNHRIYIQVPREMADEKHGTRLR